MQLNHALSPSRSVRHSLNRSEHGDEIWHRVRQEARDEGSLGPGADGHHDEARGEAGPEFRLSSGSAGSSCTNHELTCACRRALCKYIMSNGKIAPWVVHSERTGLLYSDSSSLTLSSSIGPARAMRFATFCYSMNGIQYCGRNTRV